MRSRRCVYFPAQSSQMYPYSIQAFEDGKDCLVTIVSAMGEEQAISWKEAPKGA